MENIRQAIERAKDRERTVPPRQPESRSDDLSRRSGFRSAAGYEFGPGPRDESAISFPETELNSAFLQSNRIIAHGVTNALSGPFDMLRTQILQSLDAKGQNILAITSPTPACGKTVTSVNLALSIARQPERSAVLVDLDLRKPMVASYLGLEFHYDVQSVVQGRKNLSEAVIHARIDDQQLMILPATAKSGSSELMASRAMAEMLRDLRREYSSQTIIVDLPPILSSDDVIAILPQVDCVLLVVAVGTSKVSDIEECNKHLQSTEVVRIVVNKVPKASAPYYGYY